MSKEMTDEEIQAYILTGEFSPSGSVAVKETFENQVQNEEQIERYYYKIKASKGVEDEMVLFVFFKLFDIWIGLYRLHKCDKELADVYPVCRKRDDQFKVKAIQALAFTRWKQSRFSEAIALFEEMENMIPPSPTLFENMGHTYNSMGLGDKAEEYFNKALQSNTTNRGGVLLGLGLLMDRRGKTKEGLPLCLEAYHWYKDKFAHLGDSSLIAKSGSSVSKCYHKLKQYKEAEQFAIDAVEIFEKTCGAESPLSGNARKALGDIYMDQEKYSQAQVNYKKAYLVEATKDEVNVVSLMEVHNALIHLHVQDKSKTPAERVSQFQQYEEICEKAYENIKKHLPQDGNAAVYYKLAGELFCVSGNYVKAAARLNEAIELFKVEKSIDCSSLIQQCLTLLHFATAHLPK